MNKLIATTMNKILFCIEYDFNNASPSFLWDHLATPDGLASWFADKVETNGKFFTFYWNNEKRIAKQTAIKSASHIKFRWEDEIDNKCYFEFKLIQNEITKSTTLIISDHACKNEIEDCIDLWNEQIALLRKVLGA